MNSNTYLPTNSVYKRLLGHVKPFWPVLLIGLMANILYAGIDASMTWMMRPFMDKGFFDPDLEFIRYIPFILLIAITCRGLVSAAGTYAMTYVARSVVKVLRQKVFAHIMRMPASQYDRATSASLLSKILYDVEQVAQVSSDALTDLVQNVCLIVGLLTVMMVINWRLSLLFLLTAPFIGLIVNFTNKKVRRISHHVQKTMGEVTEIASESIEGYKVVRVFGGQEYECNRFNQATEQSRKQDMKVALNRAINTTGVQFVVAIGITLIIFSTIKLSTVMTITPGAFVAIVAAMFQLIRPLKTLTNLNAIIQRGLAGAESIFMLMDTPVEPDDGFLLTNRVTGDIRFSNVSFAYDDNKYVLDDISFHAKATKTIALVGHSGSGKSTIASLIPRFYQPTSGQIFIDDIDISTLNLSSLREQIALVSQQVTLFNDTLANNIAYGQTNVSMDAVVEASKLAYADEFIQRLPNGYDTMIGENGLTLSGGQRQRLAIARAILKDAPILILDEATSALDSESEQMIQMALQQVMKNRTTIVIAHRLSTIQKADLILVLSDGQIVERGTHQELLAMDGFYAKLDHAQHLNRTHVHETVSA